MCHTVDREQVCISIHALLAESDKIPYQRQIDHKNFYPRSPCGERPQTQKTPHLTSYFYPRSPCGERQRANRLAHAPPQISIHALLAESDVGQKRLRQKLAISIHALLAESDAADISARR